MATIAKLAVEIGANTSKLNAGLKSARSKVQNFGKTVSSVGSTLTLGLTAPIALAGGKMLQLAADAEETQNLFDVSFGKMAGQAEQFAKDMSKNLGLNQFAIKEQAATLNDMTKSMGLTEQEAYKVATSMTALTQDLASFKNLDIDEAFNKIRSGLSGESEPLKRIGILVNENTIKTWAYTHGLARQGEQLTEQQKVMARVGSIMEQTSDAQGDLARTSDSVTNQWRRLKARTTELATELGTNLLPYANQVLGKLLDLAESFSGLTTSQQQLILKTGLVVAALGPALKLIGLFATVIGTLATPLGIAAIAIGLFLDKFVGFETIYEKVKTFIEGMVVVFGNLSDGMPHTALINFRKTLMDTFGRETGQKILTTLLNIKENATKVFNTVKENVTKALKPVVEFVVNLWNTILEYWDNNGESLIQKAINIFNNVKDFITSALSPLIEFIQELWGKILEYWNENGEQIKLAASNIFNAVWDTIIWVFEGIVGFISENWETIKKIFSTALDIILQIVDFFVNIFTGDWEGAWENIKTITSKFFGEDGLIASVFDLFKNAVEAVMGALHTALETIFTKMFNGVFGIVKAIWGDIVDFILEKVAWVMDKVDAVKDAIKSIVNTKVKVPETKVRGRTRNEVRDTARRMAEGGITTGPTLAMIGEGSEDEAVIPLSRLDSMMGSSGQTIQVILDGDVIAERVDARQGGKVLRMRGAI